MFPAIVKIILERIKIYLETLIDGEQAGFHFGSFFADRTNTLQIILEQRTVFRFYFQLFFSDLKKLSTVPTEPLLGSLKLSLTPDTLF